MKRHGKVAASSSIVWRFMEFLISFHRPTVLMSKYAMMIMKFLLLLVLSIIIGYAPIGCIILSAMRLLPMDYGDADGTAANKSKLRAALSIFYCLVLLQSLLFYYFLSISLDRHDRIRTVSDMCGLEDYGPKLIQRYYEDTKVQCDKDSDLPDDWNLMKFAVGLLEFGSRDDYLSGVRVLDTFVMKKIDFRMVLLSKRRSLQNLIMLLGWNRQGKREIRERAARIVAYLATDLHISQFPGALQCISSLLEASEQYYDPAVVHLPENSERGLDREGHHLRSRSPEQSEHRDLRLPVVNVDQQGNQQDVNLSSSGRLKYRADKQTTWKNRVMRLSSTYLPKFKDIKEAWHKRTTNQRTKDRLFGDEDCYSFESKGSKELVFQGLVILEKLTKNQGNCIEICRDEGLPKMITESLNFPTLLRAGCDHTLMQTLIRSLRLLSRLITAPGNDSARLRHGVSCNREAVSNLVRVLEYQVEGVQELQEQALEIVSAITFDVTKSMAIVFGRIVHRIFLPCTGHDVAFVVAEQENLRAIRLRRRAGEVLARLLSILSESDRTIIPEMLRERGSTDFLNANKDIMNLLTKVTLQVYLSIYHTCLVLKSHFPI